MLLRPPPYQRYIYNCVKCDGWVGRDFYCRFCGHQFDSTDTEQMIARSTRRKADVPYSDEFSELYKCQWCYGPICNKHIFCKTCGCEITDGDRFEMNKPHLPAYMGPLVFVAILTIFVFGVIYIYSTE